MVGWLLASTSRKLACGWELQWWASACCPLLTLRQHCGTCRSIAISSNEEQLALSLQGGPAFTLALNNQELMKADDMNFELLGPGVHTAGGLWHIAVRRETHD